MGVYDLKLNKCGKLIESVELDTLKIQKGGYIWGFSESR